MKIMISSDGPHAHYYIRLGWAKVFETLGHTVNMWNIHSKNPFDAFDEFEPDVFIGQTYNLNESLVKCIKERPSLKYCLRASDWGDIQSEINTDNYNILIANKTEIAFVEELVQSNAPEFVYNHYHDRWMKVTHNKWESVGVRPVSMLSAADVFEYMGGTQVPDLMCDLGFVGGYWEYKGRNLDPYLLQFSHPIGKYNLKIFGNQGWPGAHYLGWIDNARVKDLFVSSTICPNISEPHSQDFGYDIIERPFKVLAAGGFCISDYVQSMAEDVFVNDEIVFAKTPREFKELSDHFIANPDERIPYIQRGQKCVLENHTYFHRASTMLEELGLKEDANKCMDIYDQMLLSIGV
jgi:hypothetical protein